MEDADVPDPGDLPYAEYDERVRRKLLQGDKLRQWTNQMGWDERSKDKTVAGLYVLGERHSRQQELNKQMLKWLEDQVETAFADLSRVNLPQVSEMSPKVAKKFLPKVDLEAIDEQFVTETATRLPEA
jgi:hypothetical protein